MRPGSSSDSRRPETGAVGTGLPRAGTLIDGRYRLLRPLGAGSMGSVWAAEHVTLSRTVAVKFVHGGARPQAAERFLREARVSAAVKHRNVVEILDFGVDAEGRPYFAMEHLEGTTLAEHLERSGPMQVEEAVRLASLMLRGLSAVHDAGIVHRDLKPENVFIVADADGTFPKLLDFGLSRRAGRSDSTAEGAVVGTPEYMAPEQAAGRGDLDARADVYSAGAILFEMLAGRRPFDSGSTLKTLSDVMHAAPIPLRSLRPDLPAAIVEIVEQAMEKDRRARYPDAREMRSALEESGLGPSLDPASGRVSLSEVPPAFRSPELEPVAMPVAPPVGVAVPSAGATDMPVARSVGVALPSAGATPDIPAAPPAGVEAPGADPATSADVLADGVETRTRKRPPDERIAAEPLATRPTERPAVAAPVPLAPTADSTIGTDDTRLAPTERGAREEAVSFPLDVRSSPLDIRPSAPQRGPRDGLAILVGLALATAVIVALWAATR